MGEESTSDPTRLSREERLAAKLRENLRRRKVQARGRPPEQVDEPVSDAAAGAANPALSKPDPSG